jgi:hypothetical protein
MWNKRAYRAIYVGTNSQSGYELWDLRNRRFDHTHNCMNLENEFPTSEDFPPSEQYQKRRRGEKRNLLPISTVIEEPQHPESSERPKLPEQPKSPDLPILDTIIVEGGPPLPPHDSNAAQSQLLVNDKLSLEEALSSLEAAKWHQAMLEELHSIDENGVWELRPAPPNLHVLGSRWELTVKRDAQGNIERCKARLVVQGFGQQSDSTTTRRIFQSSESTTSDCSSQSEHIFAITASLCGMSTSATLSKTGERIFAFTFDSHLASRTPSIHIMFCSFSIRSMA